MVLISKENKITIGNNDYTLDDTLNDAFTIEKGGYRYMLDHEIQNITENAFILKSLILSKTKI